MIRQQVRTDAQRIDHLEEIVIAMADRVQQLENWQNHQIAMVSGLADQIDRLIDCVAGLEERGVDEAHNLRFIVIQLANQMAAYHLPLRMQITTWYSDYEKFRQVETTARGDTDGH